MRTIIDANRAIVFDSECGLMQCSSKKLSTGKKASYDKNDSRQERYWYCVYNCYDKESGYFNTEQLTLDDAKIVQAAYEGSFITACHTNYVTPPNDIAAHLTPTDMLYGFSI